MGQELSLRPPLRLPLRPPVVPPPPVGPKGFSPRLWAKPPPHPVPARVPSPGRAAPPFLINASGDAPPAVTRQLWGLWLNPRAPALTHTGSVAERGLSAPTAGKKRSPRQECRALPCSAVSYKPRRRGARAELPRGGGGDPLEPSWSQGGPSSLVWGGVGLCIRAIATSVWTPSAGKVRRRKKHPGQDVSTTLTRHQRIPFGAHATRDTRILSSLLGAGSKHPAMGQEHLWSPFPAPPLWRRTQLQEKAGPEQRELFHFSPTR